jgi:hypothetical protein
VKDERYNYYYILKKGNNIFGALKYLDSKEEIDIKKDKPFELILDLKTDSSFIIADGSDNYPFVIRSVDDLLNLKTIDGVDVAKYLLPSEDKNTVLTISARLYEDIDLSADNIAIPGNDDVSLIRIDDSTGDISFGLAKGNVSFPQDITSSLKSIINIDLNGHTIKFKKDIRFGSTTGNDGGGTSPET